MTSVVATIQPHERIQIIDSLRGFAIFGILLVNMELFNHSIAGQILSLYEPPSELDQLARWFIAFFGEAKFYALFAFLFGLGMHIQQTRAGQTGQHFKPFYFRCMIVLLGLGLVHAYLFWPGDILILYSVLGLLALIFFCNRRPKTLLVWVFIFLLIPLFINAALFGLVELALSQPGGETVITQTFAGQERANLAVAMQADQVYANGTFMEVTAQRVQDMIRAYKTWPFIAPNIFAMFLLGLYAGKRGLFEDLPGRLPFIHKVWAWGLAIGLAGNLAYVWLSEFSQRSIPSLALLGSLVGQILGVPALIFFYMSSLILLWQSPAWQKRLAPLAQVGRMAITNYLLQTLICTTLFYGYGLGLYGIGAAAGILVVILVYAFNILFSNWWLGHFRFGPVEWLWRSLTYMKRQPMRLALS